jgi:uncharacterized membrane-anchored protein
MPQPSAIPKTNGGETVDAVARLLFAIILLFLVAVALGLLGVVGRVLHWVIDAWSGHTKDRQQ